MKRFFAIPVLSCLLCACGVQDRTVSVTNDSPVDRHLETVGVSFDELGIRGLTAENAVVMTAEGAQIPSQVITGDDGGQALIFQADLKAGESGNFVVSKGVREVFDTLVNSRYVPERKDDYEYENNLVLGRIYGPALEGPRTFGPDIFIKNTPALVFDRWLAGRDFHRNHGEGMDCYMVGKTLGGGSCAPVSDGRVCTGDNYATQKRLCNGPVRTAAEFTWSELEFGGAAVTVKRSLSLDANTRLVHWTASFEASGKDSLDVVVGAVLHDVKSIVYGRDYISFTELASDSRELVNDDLISIGLILSDRFTAEAAELDGHAVLKFRVKCGETVDYWTASGWNKGGVESPESWNEYMKEQAFAVNNPLKIAICSVKM